MINFENDTATLVWTNLNLLLNSRKIIHIYLLLGYFVLNPRHQENQFMI